ncbi:MAG: hypothetical protein U9Q97_09805 [Acidobacteriota bacterium]|nr:hypothetical protein [Acidobacteriota bacterium]
MRDRGATEKEVISAIEEGSSEPARKGRILFRKNFAFKPNKQNKLDRLD